MVSFAGVLALLYLAVTAIPPGVPYTHVGTALGMLAGRWDCVDAGGAHTTRSYAIFPAGPGARFRREQFGREDAVVNGQPLTTYERIQEDLAGTYAIESVEGSAPGRVTGTLGLTFAGSSYNGTPFEVTYIKDDVNTIHRTAVSAGKTISAERCTRQAEGAEPSTCETPYVPAATLDGVEPTNPADFGGAPKVVDIFVRVVLDDRSNVLWTDVQNSDWHPFDDLAIESARSSTYRTAVRDCRSVPGIYLFGVHFTRDF